MSLGTNCLRGAESTFLFLISRATLTPGAVQALLARSESGKCCLASATRVSAAWSAVMVWPQTMTSSPHSPFLLLLVSKSLLR